MLRLPPNGSATKKGPPSFSSPWSSLVPAAGEGRCSVVGLDASGRWRAGAPRRRTGRRRRRRRWPVIRIRASDRSGRHAHGVPPGAGRVSSRAPAPPHSLCTRRGIDHHFPTFDATRGHPCTGVEKVTRVDLFEYQGKQLFARYGIPVSAGDAGRRPSTRRSRRPTGSATRSSSRPRCRSAGAARPAASSSRPTPTRCAPHAANILGMDIKGHIVKVVWIEKASDIAEEYYASFTLDRAAKLHLGMLSAQGGVEIEQVADEDPDAIAKIHVDPVDGLTEAQCRAWVERGEAQPDGHRRRGRHPPEALPRLHRGRRRPRRDQPADPHARRPGARARREGHARRQRGVPPPRLRRVRRDPGARRPRAGRPREGPAVRRARRLRRHHRQRRRARDEHRRHRQPGRRRARRTSSTSAAAPTPT